jgi:hypothetical protein
VCVPPAVEKECILAGSGAGAGVHELFCARLTGMRGGEFLGLKWDAIFEEFRQVGTADKKVQGTGLDWSRQFIELDGGRVWVKSQLGQDSTFTLLPVGVRSEPADSAHFN